MLYQRWTPVRCMVMLYEFTSFITCIICACLFFKLTYGFSAIFLLKGLHIYGILSGHLNILKCFFWFHVVTTLISGFSTFIVILAALIGDNPYTVSNARDVLIFDALKGLSVGLSLAAFAVSLLEIFWQKLWLHELKSNGPEHSVQLKYDNFAA